MKGHWVFCVLLGAAAAMAAGSANADCRIRLVAGTGGQIHDARTGNVLCEERRRCEIDLPDEACDLTVAASPNYGYAFDGWRGRSRDICGDTSDNTCDVKASIAGEQAISPDNRTYVIAPVFRKDSANPEPENIGLACTISKCSASGYEGRSSEDLSTQYCQGFADGNGAVGIRSVGNQKFLRLRHSTLGNQRLEGTFAPLSQPSRGWRFVGSYGKPASDNNTVVEVEVNQDSNACLITYNEAANTARQLSLSLEGSL